jgi:energy-converting hydrogenase A subunit F
MSFIIASWLSINYTMNRKNDEKEIKDDVKKAISASAKVANEVKVNDEKARAKQLRRDN